MLWKKLFMCLITFAYVAGTEYRSVGEGLRRSRRQLLWPNTTLLQFNVGVGTPTLAKNINMNYAFQANFQLPWNRTQIPTDVLVANSGLMGPTRKKRNVYESDAKLMHFYKYVEDVLNGTPTLAKNINMNYAFQANFQLPWNRTQIPTDVLVANSGLMGPTRKKRNVYESDAKLMHFYKYVEDVLNGFHYDGKNCVLQALCQVGAEPIHSDDEEDILHEIAAFVLNPTHDADENINEKDEPFPYIEAYRNGQNSENCARIYRQCKMSLVDVFTKLHHDLS